MARPLRVEFAGALYHVSSRGDRKEDIYRDEEDRRNWLDVLGTVCARFNWIVYAYCQMNNHYHLLVETVDGELSRGMRQLNGIYTQRFNRHHGEEGHLYQGRYKAILVQKEAYLLELTRYIVLNPLRAGMVEDLRDWFWSSYRAMLGLEKKPKWLATEWLLNQFAGQRRKAIVAYRKFIMQGKDVASPLEQTRHQLFLGDDSFVERYRQEKIPQISKVRRRSRALSLKEYRKRHPQRNEAMARAYLSGVYTMAQIGQYFGVHYMTVSRVVREFEAKQET